jgi:Aminotransferase class I and II
MVMVDDSHASGFGGRTGRGTAERCGVMGRIDILSSTLGKALGGASGGFIAARSPIVELLQQRCRPYLFSNALAPSVVAGSRAALALVDESTALCDRLAANTRRFRTASAAAGLEIRQGDHPIVPIMLGDARRASEGVHCGPQLLYVTAQFGMSALVTGHTDVALAAGAWLHRLWLAQPDLPHVLYTVWTRSEGLVTRVPANADARHYVNDSREVRQFHYNGGIAAAFLARLHMQTGAAEWLSLARGYQRFSMDATPEQFATKQVSKSAWGGALLATITGDNEYWAWTIRLGDWFVSEQLADGSWVNTPYLCPNPSHGQRIEITAEFALQLDTILGALGAYTA